MVFTAYNTRLRLGTAGMYRISCTVLTSKILFTVALVNSKLTLFIGPRAGFSGYL